MTDIKPTELVDVRMPKVGHGGLGAVRQWLVAEGDQVRAGDLVAEVELEKAAVDVESPATGRIVALLVDVDEEVDAGTVIAQLEPGGS